MVEFSLIAFLLFVVTGGLVDFGFGLYQWNSATKALQQGARLASISDPVDSSLKNWDGLDVSGTSPGGPFPAFNRVCSGGSQSCSSGGTYSSAAMSSIVFGRGQTTCGVVAVDRTPAMCDIFSRIQPANVVITYKQTGLGFAGRPAGPVPTITVELTGLTFDFIFLSGLLGFGPINMPAMKTTATGEDMSTDWSGS
jgi:hypothetical protein